MSRRFGSAFGNALSQNTVSAKKSPNVASNVNNGTRIMDIHLGNLPLVLVTLVEVRRRNNRPIHKPIGTAPHIAESPTIKDRRSTCTAVPTTMVLLTSDVAYQAMYRSVEGKSGSLRIWMQSAIKPKG